MSSQIILFKRDISPTELGDIKITKMKFHRRIYEKDESMFWSFDKETKVENVFCLVLIKVGHRSQIILTIRYNPSFFIIRRKDEWFHRENNRNSDFFLIQRKYSLKNTLHLSLEEYTIIILI